MQKTRSDDLNACLCVQPRRTYAIPTKAVRELAFELLSIVDNDKNKAMAIIREIMYYSPNKSVEWYYEKAIAQLSGKIY